MITIPSTEISNGTMTEEEMMIFINQNLKLKNYMLESMTKFYTYHPKAFKSIISAMYYGTVVPYEEQKLFREGVYEMCRDYFFNRYVHSHCIQKVFPLPIFYTINYSNS